MSRPSKSYVQTPHVTLCSLSILPIEMSNGLLENIWLSREVVDKVSIAWVKNEGKVLLFFLQEGPLRSTEAFLNVTRPFSKQATEEKVD